VAADLRSHTLVGRTAELVEVEAALAAAAGGRGGLLLLTGEAGVGKSRLLAEARARAGARGAAVLSGRAAPGGGPLRAVSEALLGGWRGRPFPDEPSLRPFRAALARLVPGWAEPGAPTPSPDATLTLAEGLLELFAVGYDVPVVLALEDLHAADPETLELLDRLSAGLPDRPVLVVGTWRTGEPTAVPGVPRPWATLRQLDLARLDDRSATGLALDCAGAALPGDVVTAVLDGAAGLPLLVEELLTGLVERGALRLTPDGWERTGELVLEVPAGLTELVADRLVRLAAPGRDVLRLAAVAGDVVDHRLLAEVLDADEAVVLASLRAGVEANLLAPDGPRLTWRHALTRDAVAATLLPPERAALAARLADRLDHRTDADALSRAALLWAEAGRPDRAVPALLGLAREAADRGDLASAEALVRRAGDLGGQPAVADDLVRVLTLQGRLAEARAVGAAVLDTLAGPPHAALGLTLAAAAVEAADWLGALSMLDRAAEPGDLRAHAVRADALFGAGDLAGSAALAYVVINAADGGAAVDPVALCTALEVAGRCARAADSAAAREWFARAARVAAENGLTPRRVRALHSLGTIELNEGVATAGLVEARDLAESVGMPGTVAAIDIVLAEAELTRSGPGPAVALASATSELGSRIGQPWVHDTSSLLLAFALALTGDDAATRRVLATVGDAVGPDDKRGLVHGALAVRPLLAHDYAGATAELDTATASLRRNPAGAPICIWGLWVLLRAVQDADPGTAMRQLGESQAVHRRLNNGALRLAEGVVAGRAGRRDDAAALVAEGERLLAGADWWARLLRLLVHEAALADGWGDPVTGLRADLAAFEAGGDTELARTSRALLRRAGVNVRRGRGDSTVPGWAAALGVTSREMDVLALVAGGATNAEVAARLQLSTRTVEHHVARVLAKSGCADRRTLSQWYAGQLEVARTALGDQR
jgi:DNA-binding CsgD family transcriptional regulator